MSWAGNHLFVLNSSLPTAPKRKEPKVWDNYIIWEVVITKPTGDQKRLGHEDNWMSNYWDITCYNHFETKCY